MSYPPVESSSAARAILSPTGGRANSHWVAFAAGLLAYSETSGSAPCHAEVTRAVADADGYCRQRTNNAASTMTESASALGAPEGIRTPNLLIRRHGRMPWSGRMRFALSCSSSCLDAGLSIRPIPLLHLIFKRPGSTGAGCAGWLGGPASSRDAALTARFVELRYYHRGAQYSDSGPRFRLRPLCCHRRTRLLTTANSPGGPALVGRIRCWKGAPWQFLARASQQ